MRTAVSRRAVLLGAAAVLAAPAFSLRAATAPRIVVLGGALAEIVVALGAEGAIVGRDTTSTYPETLRALPDVGYLRQVAAEGVLSLSPNLVIAAAEAGPEGVIQQIADAGVRLLRVPDGYSPAALNDRIAAIGAELGRDSEAAGLAADISGRIAAIEAKIAASPSRPRALFVLNARDGAPMAAGTATAADAMITLAGGVNVFTGHEGYRPLSLEAAIAAAPEIILTMDHALEALGGPQGLAAHPALRMTPAAQSGRIVAREGSYLLGFGPRLPDALADVARAFHPALKV